jgi:hypothetical protein
LKRLASILVRKTPLRFLIVGRLIFEDEDDDEHEDENPRKKASFPTTAAQRKKRIVTKRAKIGRTKNTPLRYVPLIRGMIDAKRA